MFRCPGCRKGATIKHFRENETCAAAAASIAAIYRRSKRPLFIPEKVINRKTPDIGGRGRKH